MTYWLLLFLVVLLGRSRFINAGHGKRSLSQSKTDACSQVPSGSKFSLTPSLRAWPQVPRSGKDADLLRYARRCLF
jgi:hypothetical protein